MRILHIMLSFVISISYSIVICNYRLIFFTLYLFICHNFIVYTYYKFIYLYTYYDFERFFLLILIFIKAFILYHDNDIISQYLR